MHSAPRCPGCRKALEVVGRESYEHYRFNKETGAYAEDWSYSEEQLKCWKCGADLSARFPMGVRSGSSQRGLPKSSSRQGTGR